MYRQSFSAFMTTALNGTVQTVVIRCWQGRCTTNKKYFHTVVIRCWQGRCTTNKKYWLPKPILKFCVRSETSKTMELKYSTLAL